jgi:quinol monooxygenase YgiN
MAYAIARVRIGDLDRFLGVFGTRGAAKRAQYNCRGVQVHQSIDDPHAMVNVFDWDRADIEAFHKDPEVQDLMDAVGLEAPPEFTFVERIAEFPS